MENIIAVVTKSCDDMFMLASSQEIIHAFQLAQEHDVNTRAAYEVRTKYAEWYAAAVKRNSFLDDEPDWFEPPEVNPKPYIHGQDRTEELIDIFDGTRGFFARYINVTLNGLIGRTMVVHQLYPEYPVLNPDLSARHAIGINSKRGTLNGYHLNNQNGYFLPLETSAYWGSSRKSELKEFWVSVIHPENGEPLVELEFPDN